MFRSLQSKLIVVYLLLILVAMQLTSLYLLTQLERTYVSQVQEDLHQRAQLLIGQLSTYISGDKFDGQGVQTFVAHWPGDVLVLDANGTVVGATVEQPDHTQLIGNKFSHDDVSPAFVGQETRRTGIDENSSTRMAFEALPITYANRVVGVAYLKRSLEEAYGRLRDIRDVLLVATMIALGSTAALSVALARTITGPVREVTRKAAEMAGGNFDQIIEVRSNDEIGQLGEMFNRMTRRLKLTLEEIQGEKHKVEAILVHMADGLLALDNAGRIIKLNPAAERIFKRSESEILGELPRAVWPEIKLEDTLAVALEESRTLTQEVRFKSFVFMAYITPLYSEPGHPAGSVIIFHDITELEKLEALRREFVANVSHELKTPLTTVKSYVETLLDGAAEDTEVRARFLRVVENETERMARLVRDLLHLSQLDQGAATWDIQPHEVPPLIDECLARLSVPVQAKNLSVRREYRPGTPAGLFDWDKLQQVLLNLLANSVEFTPADGQITVAVDTDDAMIRVSVKDSGIGIPREDLPRIFERFYRVDKARSRMLGGTGLGLAIAKQIVELLGGEIAIESELGAGTEVTFTLPVVQPVDSRWT